ncbi:MAG: RNA polymerase sigma factor [Deltaproteobacteria bacterium]|nr:RNA polymerase sigma factor [Deltaproteobacteria bacterium]
MAEEKNTDLGELKKHDASCEESPTVSAETAASIASLPSLSLLQTPAKEAVVFDEDQALVAKAKVGDRQAFSKLYSKHHGRVFAMCSRLLRDPVEVEDAVQQTYLEAWKSLHRFEGRSKFTTWITRIAIHTCLGLRRKLRRLFFSEDTSPVDRVEDGHFSSRPIPADEHASYRNRRKSVAEALSHLSEKKRVVFVLAELEGMTAPEISEILSVPDATVRTRLFHARKEFAVLVRKHPGFADLFDGD